VGNFRSVAKFVRGILRRSARQSASRPRQGNNAHLARFAVLGNLFSARHKRTTGDTRKEVLVTTSDPSSKTPLPARPSLQLLSNLAKQLRKAHVEGDAGAIERFQKHHPRFTSWSAEQIAKTAICLRDSQLVIAREYGFEHWAAMKVHVLSLQGAASSDSAVRTLIKAAASGDLSSVAKALDEHPDSVNVLGGDNREFQQFKTTALHKAAEGGHLAVVELLLNRGADPDIRDEGDNATALHFAAELGSLPIVKLLIERGADVNGFGDLHGWDVIGWATLHDHVHQEVANYLLNNGAQHNIFTAVAMGDIDAIRKLAEVSRDVMDKPMAIWEGRGRPLHLAVRKKRPSALSVLLDLGADIDGSDMDGLTALDHAALDGDVECVEVLLARHARINLPAAFALRRRDLTEAILRENPDVLKPGQRWCALIFDRGALSGEVIEELIARGASVDLRMDSSHFGTKAFTPLHSAAWTGNLEAIRVLVKHGAELQARDGTYKATPAEWADHAGRKEAAELLRSLGG
jgi:ankyrin repeat protein